jgi:hypothetical protein
MIFILKSRIFSVPNVEIPRLKRLHAGLRWVQVPTSVRVQIGNTNVRSAVISLQCLYPKVPPRKRKENVHPAGQDIFTA